MRTPFATFSPAHLAVLAAITLSAAALAFLGRRRPATIPVVRWGLAIAIAAAALAGTVVPFARGSLRPPHGLPLDLCDVVEWVTVYALVTMRPWPLELAYFLGLAGSGMALLTPDVGAELGRWSEVQFFVAHGGVVVAVLFLVATGRLRPRRGASWRVFGAVNAYAAAVAAFNALTGTNYMYLREKPASGTLLDLLGPWPWYILAAEPVAALLLLALALPFRRAGAGGHAPGRGIPSP